MFIYTELKIKLFVLIYKIGDTTIDIRNIYFCFNVNILVIQYGLIYNDNLHFHVSCICKQR